jgi:RNase adapter protein RapZ
MGDFVVIAGLSGAGRSQAANDFEDLGWFVIDNLPPALMPKVTELADAKGSSITRIVLVAGTGHYDRELVDALTELRRSVPRVRILFLDCATPELVRRYEQTRRRHPIPGHSVEEAIEAERRILEPVRAEADVIIDTTELNVHQLRDRVRAAFGDEETDVGMVTTIRSFGFKHGAPIDADIVLDVRFLPNPHWVDELRPLTGLDEPVRDYVLGQDAAKAFVDKIVDLLELLLPAYRDEGKAYLSIAIGCTGGRHRSVAIAEELRTRLAESGTSVTASHRDVEK